MTSRRDEVLAAALDLLDEVGLDALTTRKLAEKLGVQPGALYRHFDSKRSLLNAMVARLTADAGSAGEPPEDWAGMLRYAAVGARATMLTRRDGARLMATYLVPADETAQRFWHRLIGALTAAGIPPADATVAVDTVFAYVNGFAIEEQSRDGFPAEPGQRALRDKSFRAGLDLIIAGVTASRS
ncbi:TetR family transcriptional regulator [Kutzneria kofuensis]|uniref:TetR/AcrR family tetracycline transcriptional repressor n=1 Tax=Kutzneria kofuensis TaxID=103725 RepID=A0A7W9KIU7_9PSEU|nr:TetR family transcriptional regulator [Kutzneria kofuensis]MBB5893354.1 TetR/AcrR family tetracycline transcriptional repressor [Kutzneria kofuensis]